MVAPWPVAIIERPLTLPPANVAVYGDLDLAGVSITIAGMTASNTSEGLHAGFGYGISDKLTIGAEYAITLSSFEAKGPLTLYGEDGLMHTPKLYVAFSADLVVDFDSVDAMGNSATSETLQAGLGARYLVAPKIAIFTGTPYGPGPVGQHLSIGFQSGAPITLAIPAGVGLQATPQLFAWVSTVLADISISNSSTTIIFKDNIPFEIGALYSATKNIDVGAFLDFPDLEHAGDFYEVGVMGRYYTNK